MDEVKIWAVDGDSNAVPLEPKGQMDSEWSFEDTLVKTPGLLMPDLTLVGRQTLTEGGPLDLLGVDSDGRLVVFELKRGTLSRDAVAQIIDYASDLDGMELGRLAEHISESSGQRGIKKIEDFKEWYEQEFGEQGLEALKPLRLFLIGLGADGRTERMVSFLANNGTNISLLTFHGFLYDGKTLLAKQVRVEGVADSEPRPADGRLSTAEKRENLARRVETSGVHGLFQEVKGMFQENWPEHRLTPWAWLSSSIGQRAYGLGIGLKGSRGLSVRIDPEPGRVRLVFYPRAKKLCLDEFRKPLKEIPYETWRKNREPLEDPETEIQFLLTAEGWATHKECLSALTRAVHEAWDGSGLEDGAD